MLLYTFYPTIEKCYENVMCLLGTWLQHINIFSQIWDTHKNDLTIDNVQFVLWMNIYLLALLMSLCLKLPSRPTFSAEHCNSPYTAVMLETSSLLGVKFHASLCLNVK